MVGHALVDGWLISNKSAHILSSNLVKSMEILILFSLKADLGIQQHSLSLLLKTIDVKMKLS